jgi:hypothetical protein
VEVNRLRVKHLIAGSSDVVTINASLAGEMALIKPTIPAGRSIKYIEILISYYLKLSLHIFSCHIVALSIFLKLW